MRSVFRLLLPPVLALLLMTADSCSGPADPSGILPETADTEAEEREIPEIRLAEDGSTEFRLVYDVDVPDALRGLYFSIRDAFHEHLGAELLPYDDYQKELSFETVRIAEMTDYMKYPVPEGTDNIEINSFDAESLFIGRRILTEGDTGYTASYDIGGQFPGVRTMRLVWPEKTEE